MKKKTSHWHIEKDNDTPKLVVFNSTATIYIIKLFRFTSFYFLREYFFEIFLLTYFTTKAALLAEWELMHIIQQRQIMLET